MKEPMKVGELNTLVKAFVKWPHEYRLWIGDVEIERAITGGIVFTAGDKILNQLIEKLNVSKSLLESSFESKLISIGRGKIKVEGVFTKKEDLLDHVYNELMKKESPDYFKFMDALAAAPLE